MLKRAMTAGVSGVGAWAGYEAYANGALDVSDAPAAAADDIPAAVEPCTAWSAPYDAAPAAGSLAVQTAPAAEGFGKYVKVVVVVGGIAGLVCWKRDEIIELWDMLRANLTGTPRTAAARKSRGVQLDAGAAPNGDGPSDAAPAELPPHLRAAQWVRDVGGGVEANLRDREPTADEHDALLNACRGAAVAGAGLVTFTGLVPGPARRCRALLTAALWGASAACRRDLAVALEAEDVVPPAILDSDFCTREQLHATAIDVCAHGRALYLHGCARIAEGSGRLVTACRDCLARAQQQAGDRSAAGAAAGAERHARGVQLPASAEGGGAATEEEEEEEEGGEEYNAAPPRAHAAAAARAAPVTPPSSPAEPRGPTVTVTDPGRTRLREDPDGDLFVGAVMMGDVLSYVEDRGDFTLVRLRDGTQGWIRSAYVSADGQ